MSAGGAVDRPARQDEARSSRGPALIIWQGSLTLAWHSNGGHLNHARLQ